MANVLLELSTEKEERPTIKVDGSHYELRAREDFNLSEDAEFASLVKDFTGSSPERDAAKMVGFLDRIIKLAVAGISDEVLAKLSDTKKVMILGAFNKEAASRRALPPVVPAAEPIAAA
ncbi:MAG: hypothetical protein PHS14_02905 [Elusimicrobia bacterium]|nr:hypothetical protein [Elusimicrobiota bacterium]